MIRYIRKLYIISSISLTLTGITTSCILYPFLGLGDDPLDDGLPYTLMTYANGPGFYDNMRINNDGTNVTRLDLDATNFLENREYRYAATGWRDSATV